MEYYIAHHGTKGQQWGVRNGPPYPLDSRVSKKIVRNFNKNWRDSNKRRDVINKSGLMEDVLDDKVVNSMVDITEACSNFLDDPVISKYFTDVDTQVEYAIPDMNRYISEFKPKTFEEYASSVPWALYEDQTYYNNAFQRYLDDNGKSNLASETSSLIKDLVNKLDSDITGSTKYVLNIDENTARRIGRDITEMIKNDNSKLNSTRMVLDYANGWAPGIAGTSYYSNRKSSDDYYYHPESMPLIKAGYEEYKKTYG